MGSRKIPDVNVTRPHSSSLFNHGRKRQQRTTTNLDYADLTKSILCRLGQTNELQNT